MLRYIVNRAMTLRQLQGEARLNSAHGSFVWYELVSPDPDASKAFYDAVVGWTVQPAPEGAIDYRMITAPDGGNTGGVMRLSPEMAAGGARAAWLGYVGVDDVDAAAAKLRELGGMVLMGPWTMPGVGRIAVVTDPWGAPFYLMRGATEGATSTAFAPGVTGRVAWNELTARDLDGALGFYEALFGWESPERMTMPNGAYAFLDHRGTRIGAMATAREGAPGGWRYYLRVEHVDAAGERATAAGGAVTMGPYDVPGGDRILIGTDPHGVEFALVGPGR